MVVVKAYFIDLRRRARGTYMEDLQELDVETDVQDPDELGRLIHDTIYGRSDRRYFVRIVGVSD